MPSPPRFLILADGEFGPMTSKTANSVIRYLPDRVVGVVDRTAAGRTAQDVLGFGGAIPVVASMTEGLARKPDAVLIGTTHFINAVVQRNHLAKVAAIRIAAPATTSLPPFCDWPEDLARLVEGGVWHVEGGHDYDGRRFMPLNVAQARAAAREIRARGHEIACHGFSHDLVYDQSPEIFRNETLRSKKFLEDTVGEAVLGYRAASY